MLLGLIVVVIHSTLFQYQQRLLFSEGQNITINGKIDSFFKQISHGYEASFVVHQINSRKIPVFFRPTIRVILNSDNEKPKLGQRLSLESEIKPIYGRLNEAGLDLEKYYIANHWHARAVVKQTTVLSNSINYRYRLHKDVELLVRDLGSKAYLLALGFGDRRGLNTSDWRQLQSTGLLHLMAISGLHISLIFGFFWYFGRIVGIAFPYRFRVWAPVTFALFGAMMYAFLAGFSIPTQRALMACFIVFIMKANGNHLSHWRLLLLICSILLLFDPFSVLSPSFWLSFSAVSVILIFIGLGGGGSNSWWHRVCFFLKLQLWLLITLAPISILVFSGFSLLSPIYNFLFVPLVSVVALPLVVFALLVTSITPNWAKPFWQMADWSLKPILYSLKWGGLGWIDVPSPYAIIIFILISLLIISFLVRSYIPIFFISVVMLWSFPQKEPPNWRLDLLDVGHGLAVLIEKNNKAVLYDTGMGWEGGSYAESVIEPILKNRGIMQLDGLILSHLDADHAGGRLYVESKLFPLWKRSSQKIESYKPCVKGEQWYWQQLRFEVLWPPKLTVRAYNPHSCVIKISGENISILLTGDIDAISEFILTRQGEKLTSDILIVPHHGSNTSSKSLFVSNVSPDIAIASLAKGNRWNLPSSRVREVYYSEGIPWMDTGSDGQISLYVYDDQWIAQTARAQHSPRWYRQIIRKGVE